MTVEQINEAYSGADSYADIVENLLAFGVKSYMVDVATSVTVFRLAGGETNVRFTGKDFRAPEVDFDAAEVKNAIAANQKGQTDFHQFMDHIARAGVRFYEATLNGENKRVEYFGLGASHVEAIPL